MGFPPFKSRRRATPSVRFTTGAIRVEPDRSHVTLPRLGRIKTHESTRKLARRLQAGAARILSATVRLCSGRWYCAFTVEVTRTVRAPARPDATVGVDLGLSTLAVLSTGQRVPNPRHLAASQRKLRAAARTMSRRSGPNRRTGQRPSRRWQRAKDQLTRRHARVGNLRRDALHKLTPAWPPRMPPSWSRTSTSPGCWQTGAWPATSPTPGSPSCAASWPTRPAGTPARSPRPLVPLLQDVLGLPDGDPA
jgi:transposase